MIKYKQYVNSADDKLEKNLHAHIMAFYMKLWLYMCVCVCVYT